MSKLKPGDRWMMKMWRSAVLTIWGERCVKCGDMSVECHHIVRRSKGVLRYDPHNGIPLCKRHHDWADTLEGRQWVHDRAPMEYLIERDVLLNDYLQKCGMSRQEFHTAQAETLKRIIANGSTA